MLLSLISQETVLKAGNAKMKITISSIQSSQMTLGTCRDGPVRRHFDRPYLIAGVTMADVLFLVNGFAELMEQARELQKPSLDPFVFRGRTWDF